MLKHELAVFIHASAKPVSADKNRRDEGLVKILTFIEAGGW